MVRRPLLFLVCSVAFAHDPHANMRPTRAPGTPSAEPLDPDCLFTVPCKARPVIELLGDSPVRIHVLTAREKGALAADSARLRKYEDSGATCSDAVDGALDNDVITTGEIVDLDRVGSYSFHYECYNKRGMAARMVTRTIVVYGNARDAAFSATPAPTPAADWQVDGAVQLSGYTPTSFRASAMGPLRAALCALFAVEERDVVILRVTLGDDFNSDRRRRLALQEGATSSNAGSHLSRHALRHAQAHPLLRGGSAPPSATAAAVGAAHLGGGGLISLDMSGWAKAEDDALAAGGDRAAAQAEGLVSPRAAAAAAPPLPSAPERQPAAAAHAEGAAPNPSVHVFFQIRNMVPRAAHAIAGHLHSAGFADELLFELSKKGLEVDKLRLEDEEVHLHPRSGA